MILRHPGAIEGAESVSVECVCVCVMMEPVACTYLYRIYKHKEVVDIMKFMQTDSSCYLIVEKIISLLLCIS